MKLSLTLRALGKKTLSNEGHGLSRAAQICALDGFSRRGTLFETYRAKSLSAFEFSIEDWKDVPQGLKPSSARVLWHG